MAIGHPSSTFARVRHVEQTWKHPDFDRHNVRSVLILPAVTWDGNPEASMGPSNAWLDAFSSADYRWVPAEEVWKRLSTKPRFADSLLKSIRAQVQRSGSVDRWTARALGSEFDVDGVLCLRVDRWEARFAGGSRHTATIDLNCSLADTTGTVLWRISGRSLKDGPIVKGASLEASPSVPEKMITVTQPSGGGAGSSGGGSQGSGGGGGGGASAGGGASGGGSGGSGASVIRVSTPTTQGPATTIREGDQVDVSPIFRGALMSLFTDWVPRLPPASKRAR